MEITDMKLYAAQFPGHYITGNAVVLAPDRKTALQNLNQILEEQGLGFAKEHDVFEIDIVNPSVSILYNGDM